MSDTVSSASSFFSLADQTAIVTGAAQGIGAGIARRLASAGAKVAVLDIQVDQAGWVEAELGDRGMAVACDVTDPNAWTTALETIESRLGPVSILVNNAGITGRAVLSWELSADEVRKVFEINLIGVFNGCKAVVPNMIARGYGRIVNIASIAGKEGNPTLLPYSASKAAVINLTKALAKELAGRGNLCVNAISPAVVRTPILDGLPQSTIDYMLSKIPMGRPCRIDEVASLVHFLASSESSFCTGQCYDISGGRATY